MTEALVELFLDEGAERVTKLTSRFDGDKYGARFSSPQDGIRAVAKVGMLVGAEVAEEEALLPTIPSDVAIINRLGVLSDGLRLLEWHEYGLHIILA